MSFSNSSSPDSSVWSPPPYELAVFRFSTGAFVLSAQSALDCLFLAAIFRPLCLLAKSRSALQIMCSKAVVAFLVNFAFLVDAACRVAVRRPLASLGRLALVHALFLNYCNQHVLMLALNRAHSVFFPFHYASWIKRGLALQQCAVAWTAALGLAVCTVAWELATDGLSGAYALLLNPVNDCVNQWAIYAAMLLYAALLLKLAWHKYCAKSMRGIRTNSDYLVSTAACMAGMCPFLAIALITFVQYTNVYQAEPVLRTGIYLLVLVCRLLMPCSEELCLLAICADFRNLVRTHYCLRRSDWSRPNPRTNTVAVLQNNFVPE